MFPKVNLRYKVSTSECSECKIQASILQKAWSTDCHYHENISFVMHNALSNHEEIGNYIMCKI